MNPILNPYAPGAGASPPELAGRDELLERASIALQRIASGRFGRSLILTGLRGTGKTVLLNRMRLDAEAQKFITVRFEISESRSLPSLLIPGLKSALFKLEKSKTKAVADFVKQGIDSLKTFASAMKFKYHDVEFGLEVESSQDSPIITELDESLSSLFQDIGAIAREKKTAIVLFIDELQVLEEKQLASLIRAFHVAAQDMLPITMIAAGLPQIPSRMGSAKTYAERLFEFFHIGQLNKAAAMRAIVVPAEKQDVVFQEVALKEILKQTQGYPYFLQEWGKHAWNIATNSPITGKDAREASFYALLDLDASFFRVRFDQLQASEKYYLRAMAELGPGPYASGKVASVLNKSVADLATVRSRLIKKGLIYSPTYGEIAFTVPLFDGFMKRMTLTF